MNTLQFVEMWMRKEEVERRKGGQQENQKAIDNQLFEHIEKIYRGIGKTL